MLIKFLVNIFNIKNPLLISIIAHLVKIKHNTNKNVTRGFYAQHRPRALESMLGSSVDWPGRGQGQACSVPGTHPRGQP